jgi:hypothetical protein
MPRGDKKDKKEKRSKNIQGRVDALWTCSGTRTVSLVVRLPLVSREPDGRLTVKEGEARREQQLRRAMRQTRPTRA